MKTLCLIRHAKTSWTTSPTAADKERPLDERGIQDARHLGTYLQQHLPQPLSLLASPAVRTHETAKILAEYVNINTADITLNEKVYNASVEELLAILMQIPNHIDHLILVGHNPGITLLANYLGEAHIATMTTASAFALSLDMKNWSDLTIAEAQNLFHFDPHLAIS